MPILIPPFPPAAPLSEDAARFLVIGRCADGIRQFAADRYGPDPHQVAAGMAAALAAATPQRSRRPLAPPAARLLRIAWQHELAARLGDAFDDATMRRAMAHNLPVNAYYALFSALRALNQVRGAPDRQHTGMHREFANCGLAVLPLPWSASLTGDPEHPDQCQLGPPGWFTPCKVDPIRADQPPAAYLFCALRMTRKWKLEQAREDWLRDGKRNRRPNGQPYKILPAAARKRLVAAQWPTTLLDFVYELRRRADYEHVDEYIAATSDAAIERFHDGVLFLADFGLLLVEAQLAAYTGTDALHKTAADWAASTAGTLGAWAAAPVRDRVEVIAACGVHA
jgi:hypothetical protein